MATIKGLRVTASVMAKLCLKVIECTDNYEDDKISGDKIAAAQSMSDLCETLAVIREMAGVDLNEAMILVSEKVTFTSKIAQA